MNVVTMPPAWRIAAFMDRRKLAGRHLVDPVPGEVLRTLRYDWPFWEMPGQGVPPGDWRTWLVMAGRGFGKTRMGAEWVRAAAMAGDNETRIALVGATRDEVRRVMVEGDSGVLSCCGPDDAPVWESTLGRLAWRTGAVAHAYSAENYEALRGPQHSHAWCDELAKWPYVDATWRNLQMGLRIGELARAMVTTTPRPIALLRGLVGDDEVVISRGRTTENAHLDRRYQRQMVRDYAGTRFGRQELDGDLIEEAQGALWTRDLIEACRVRAVPELVRIVIGVDPPAGRLSGGQGDACGIIVCGLGRDGVSYVIADASVESGVPKLWATAVATAAALHGADRVVAEANNGGAMVESVLRAADAALPVTLVHASHGKAARAEPVQLRYTRGMVKHVGAFPDLEDELCGMITGGGYEGPGRSPDRADACVWALSELMRGTGLKGPGVRVV